MRPTEIEAAIRAGRVDELLLAAQRASSVSATRYYASALSHAISLADPGALDDAVLRLAEELGVDRAALQLENAAPPPHAVHVPMVMEATDRGFVRLLFVSFDTGLGGLELAATARAAVASALRLAHQRLELPPSRPHVFSAAQPAAFAGVHVRGASLGAAAFVSAFSLWSGRSVRQGLVVSAALTEAGEVRPVGSLIQKLDGVLSACASAKRLVVATADLTCTKRMLGEAGASLELFGAADLDELVSHCVAPEAEQLREPDQDLYALRREFDRGWSRYRWPAIRERLDRLAGQLPETRPDLLVPVYTMLGGVSRHLGDPEQSLLLLERAAREAGVDSAPCVPDSALTFYYRHLSLSYRELGRFEEARRAAESSVRIAEEARLRGDLVKGLGCAGLVALGYDDPRAASRLHQRAVDVALAHDPSEAPQSIGYLVDALGRQGRVREAREAFAQGMELDDARVRRGRRSQRSWLHTILGAALVRAGHAQEALELLSAKEVTKAMTSAPLPGLLIRRALGQALVQLDQRERGYDLLAASPSAYGASSPPQQRFRLHLNVLWEARLRADRDDLGDDARARARVALRQLPSTPGVQSLLAGHAQRVAQVLESRAAASVPLTELLATCERLG